MWLHEATGTAQLAASALVHVTLEDPFISAHAYSVAYDRGEQCRRVFTNKEQQLQEVTAGRECNAKLLVNLVRQNVKVHADKQTKCDALDTVSQR